MDEREEIMWILMNNMDKPFVHRILNPSKVLKEKDGMVATHKMSWGDIETENGKKYVVFPSIQEVNGKLVDLGDSAFDRAMKSGNYIMFDDQNQADWFSKRYKSIWDK